MSRRKTPSLSERILEGDTQAAARLITLLEDGAPRATTELEKLYTHSGKAVIIGVTGAPGVGKSTLIDSLVETYRWRGKKIGIIAIDPTSALTGGALLGDRIRMPRSGADPEVFVRSLATRGWTGGLAKAAAGACRVMEALGKDIVFLETVGSGQAELDIVSAADTTLLVLSPDSGDDIQAMKAGILELADVIAINKADKEGADRLKAGLEAGLTSRRLAAGQWRPPVVTTEAINDKGTAGLIAAIEQHHQYLLSCDELLKRRRERLKQELLSFVRGNFDDTIRNLEKNGRLEAFLDDIQQGKMRIRDAARTIMRILPAGRVRNRSHDGI